MANILAKAQVFQVSDQLLLTFLHKIITTMEALHVRKLLRDFLTHPHPFRMGLFTQRRTFSPTSSALVLLVQSQWTSDPNSN